MRFNFYSPQAFEPWDWSNPDTVGIGGSETAVVEMSWRLAARGHKVHVFAPTPEKARSDFRGTAWRHTDDADFSAPGIWILSRCPQLLDQFADVHPAQERWLICQDEDYPDRLTPPRLAKLDRVVALCNDQATHLKAQYPEYASRVCQSSNGIKDELVQEVLAEGHERNPRRLLYPSSPDRGLALLLPIFKRSREFVPDLELDVCYGFDNIDKVVAEKTGKPGYARFVQNIAELKEAIQAPGIVHHGRMPQKELYRLWAQTGLWVHPSTFRETNCITCQEAQALGAIPITCPLWAIGEYVMGGTLVEGDPDHDVLTQCRMVAALCGWAIRPERQEKERARLMPLALARFSWERTADQWEGWLDGDGSIV